MSYVDDFLNPSDSLRIHSWRIFHHVTTGPHTLSCYLLTYVTDNYSIHVWDERTDIIKPGDMLLIHPGQNHRFVTPHRLWMYHCIFEDETVDAPYISDMPKQIAHIPLNLRKHIENLYDQISYKNTHPVYDKKAVTEELAELLEIYRTYSVSDIDRVNASGYKYVIAAMNIIQSERDITIADIAGKLSLNPDYLNRVFRSYMNISLSEYKIILRLNDAAVILEQSEKKVSEIALISGYRNVSLFCRQFRKFFSMTPLQYRIFIRRNQYI